MNSNTTFMPKLILAQFLSQKNLLPSIQYYLKCALLFYQAKNVCILATKLCKSESEKYKIRKKKGGKSGKSLFQ